MIFANFGAIFGIFPKKQNKLSFIYIHSARLTVLLFQKKFYTLGTMYEYSIGQNNERENIILANFGCFGACLAMFKKGKPSLLC